MATPTTKSIKGTQTEKNLVISYMDETQSYARYTYYAQQADKELYYPIGEIFRDTAANELHHAKVFFKMLEGGTVNVSLDVDAGVIGDTATNLQIAIKEEEVDGVELYKHFADVAEQEGFPEIASHFRAIGEVEATHRDRFERYLKQVQEGTVWKRDHAIKWRCLVCGYEFTGTEPPKKCPGCDHPYQHYMAMD